MSDQATIQSATYANHCAFAVSLNKLDVPGGKCFLEKNGRRYSFSNGVAKFLFSVIPGRIKAAEKNWATKEN